LPVIASTSAVRAWGIGVALAFILFWLPFVLPFGLGSYLLLLGVVVLAVYALTVRPSTFAASGVLLGIAPSFAWGVIDGLQKCAKFNSRPNGGCEADPSSQLLVTTVVYAAALLATAAAARSSNHS
jgi:hypothetical protein